VHTCVLSRLIFVAGSHFITSKADHCPEVAFGEAIHIRPLVSHIAVGTSGHNGQTVMQKLQLHAASFALAKPSVGVLSQATCCTTAMWNTLMELKSGCVV
jgi:hypothetical protein